MKRRGAALGIAIVVTIIVAIPLLAVTETGLEDDLKQLIGYRVGETCPPMTNLGSSWRSEPALPKARDEMRAAVIEGQVFLAGGADSLTRSDSGNSMLETVPDLLRFTPEDGFTPLAPMPEALNHTAVVSHDRYIYVAGGYGARIDRDTSRHFFRYDPDEDRWSRMPSMPSERAAMAHGVIGDRLILAGGEQDGRRVATTVAFDFETNRWTPLPDMPLALGHVAGTVASGKLYALGGRSEQSDAMSTALSYDPASQRWEQLPPLPMATGGAAAITVDGDPIALGGGDDRAGTVIGSVQRWEPADGEWSLLPELRTPRHGPAAAMVNGRAYVFGGSHCAFFDASDRVESLAMPEAKRGPRRFSRGILRKVSEGRADLRDR